MSILFNVVETTKRPKSISEKKTTSIWRRVYMYVSVLSFVVVLFFSATGLTLNHAGWFNGKVVKHNYSGNVPIAWVNVTDATQIKKLEIVELLRKSYDIKGYVSDFLIKDGQCSISFKGPGYSADAFIVRKDGSFKVTELKMGVGALLNDLHKGSNTGKGGNWFIDVSAVFLALVSLSGLMMLLLGRTKKISGLR